MLIIRSGINDQSNRHRFTALMDRLSAALLWLLYRSSQFGLATEAVSESERSAAAVGVSPNYVAVVNWALGSAIACIAGILVVPIITLQVTSMTSLVLAALAAALVGEFKRFPVATAAGFALGIGQALVGRESPSPHRPTTPPASAISPPMAA